MKFSRSAAEEVVEKLSSHRLIAVRIEGGAWRDPGFEARLDQIWDSVIDPPISEKLAYQSNRDAANFIRTRPSMIDTFIITVAPITGYVHKQGD